MGRSPCCDKNGLKKGPWTPEEDLKLIQYIEAHGAGNWRTLPKNAGLQRCGKSCRLRWTNYLRPDIKRGRFSFEEEETIIQLHSVLGNKWSAIAARLPGRTDNEIKNYWNTHIRKRLLKMGIDPVTHSPRMDLLDLTTLLNSSSSHLNLSSLLGLQTLMNPDLLRVLIATLLTSSSSSSSSYQENPEFLLQKFDENQLMNAQMQNQAAAATSILQQAPFPPCSSSFVESQTVQLQGNNSMDLSMILKEINGQTCQENSGLPWIGGYGMSDNTTTDNSENCSTFCSQNNGSSSTQNFGLDSVISTPLSGSPMNSSQFINCGSNGAHTQDDKEGYCSDFMKFEIPASFDDFDNFM